MQANLYPDRNLSPGNNLNLVLGSQSLFVSKCITGQHQNVFLYFSAYEWYLKSYDQPKVPRGLFAFLHCLVLCVVYKTNQRNKTKPYDLTARIVAGEYCRHSCGDLLSFTIAKLND